MLNLEQAIKIAKRYDPKIDNGEETEDAYIFGDSKNMSFDDSPVVVLKKDGEVINITAYYLESSAKTLREFKL